MEMVNPSGLVAFMQCLDDRNCCLRALLGWLTVYADFGVAEILHAHPGDDDPHPAGNSRTHNQSGIVASNGQGCVVFQIGWCIRCLAHVPRPAPDAEAGAHSYNKDYPRRYQHDPAPPFGLTVIPFVVRVNLGRCHERSNRRAPVAASRATVCKRGDRALARHCKGGVVATRGQRTVKGHDVVVVGGRGVGRRRARHGRDWRCE